jgi:hypothetical protein
MVAQSVISELSFVDVHERAPGSARAIGEPEAFVQGAGFDIGFVDSDVHRFGSTCSGLIQRGADKGPSNPATPKVGDYVELGEVALLTLLPDRKTEPQDGEPVGSAPCEQYQRVAAFDEQPDPVGQFRRRWRGFLEFTIEVVEETADRFGIACPGDAYRLVGRHRMLSLAHGVRL